MLFLFFQFGGPPPPVTDPSSLTAAYEALWPSWVQTVQPYALDLFAALAGLDLAFFGWSLWRYYRGDITAAILSTTNRLLLIGLFLDLLLNGPTWMKNIVDMFTTVGKAANNNNPIQPSTILAEGGTIVGNMLFQAFKSSLLSDFLTGIAIVIAALVILISFVVITVEFVITKVQTFLGIGMGVFFLGFGGSTWTRTYVERYFSYSVSSGVRLMTLYFLINAGWTISQTWINLAQQAPTSAGGVLACWNIGAGAVIYAVICWRGPAIAAGILGGGPNLSHNDIWGAMAAATQAGVTAALIASGVGSAAGAGAAASAGGATMSAGATAPSSASSAAAGTGAKQAASAALHATGTLQSASSNGNGQKNNNPPNGDFGGLDT